MRKAVFFLAVGLLLWAIFLRDPLAPAPAAGVRISAVPEQTPTTQSPWTRGDYTVRPLARYSIKARVLGRERYRFSERSDILPFDLALGWGAMSDSEVLTHISISQSNRWYYYTYDAECPISHSEIATQSANVHCLPATDSIRTALAGLRVNSFVELRGSLVEIQKSGESEPLRSSLTREDEGAGSCEVLWVDAVRELLPGAEK